MRSLKLLPLLALLCIGAAQPTPAQRMLLDARQMLAQAKESHYSHRTRVDEARGQYDFDCSGLVDYALKRVSPDHLKAIPKGRKHVRPLAIDFYNAFTSTPPATGWKPIARIADLQPGDVIAWRFRKQRKGKSTGHVMIVNALPVRTSDHLFAVQVIDSTGSSHADDSRQGQRTGIGKGTLWFVADDQGRPVAFRWNSPTGRTVHLPIAAGRAIVPVD